MVRIGGFAVQFTCLLTPRPAGNYHVTKTHLGVVVGVLSWAFGTEKEFLLFYFIYKLRNKCYKFYYKDKLPNVLSQAYGQDEINDFLLKPRTNSNQSYMYHM